MAKKKKDKKLKVYVLMVSEKFPATHPLAGSFTYFPESIKQSIKIHTIRTNYKFWKKRIKEINNGNAYLSVRHWSGKPYNSKQVEITRFYQLGIQKVTKISNYVEIDKKRFYKQTKLANNDGLSIVDFENWFHKPLKNGCIIHFTGFRYE